MKRAVRDVISESNTEEEEDASMETEEEEVTLEPDFRKTV